jgi:hypothetical protein
MIYLSSLYNPHFSMNSLKLSALLLIILIAVSCKKDNPQPGPVTPVEKPIGWWSVNGKVFDAAFISHRLDPHQVHEFNAVDGNDTSRLRLEFFNSLKAGVYTLINFDGQSQKLETPGNTTITVQQDGHIYAYFGESVPALKAIDQSGQLIAEIEGVWLHNIGDRNDSLWLESDNISVSRSGTTWMINHTITHQSLFTSYHSNADIYFWNFVTDSIKAELSIYTGTRFSVEGSYPISSFKWPAEGILFSPDLQSHVPDGSMLKELDTNSTATVKLTPDGINLMIKDYTVLFAPTNPDSANSPAYWKDTLRISADLLFK